MKYIKKKVGRRWKHARQTTTGRTKATQDAVESRRPLISIDRRGAPSPSKIPLPIASAAAAAPSYVFLMYIPLDDCRTGLDCYLIPHRHTFASHYRFKKQPRHRTID